MKGVNLILNEGVALRKESVDRNEEQMYKVYMTDRSLSARRAWIEIGNVVVTAIPHVQVALRKESVDRNIRSRTLAPSGIVALRKESVDRNDVIVDETAAAAPSLSARRAWIEIAWQAPRPSCLASLSARRAWIEIA